MKRKLKVFLGGKIDKGNAWRSAVKDLKLKHIEFFDPYKKDWEAEDVYDEIRQMVSSNLVAFFRGGRLSKKEQGILKFFGKPRFRLFDSFKTLAQFLVSLDKRVTVPEDRKKGGNKKNPTTNNA